MKQKVEIEISRMDTSKSSRVKALTTAIAFSGVESVAIKGNEKKLLEVSGDGMDLDGLITSLSKNVGPAEPLSISILGGRPSNQVQTVPIFDRPRSIDIGSMPWRGSATSPSGQEDVFMVSRVDDEMKKNSVYEELLRKRGGKSLPARQKIAHRFGKKGSSW